MKLAFLIGALVITLVVGLIVYNLFNSVPQPASAMLNVGKSIFKVEIADTPELRAQGLSGRDSLASDGGMLFIFPQSGIYSFWMKDMKFDLDFVWISGDRVVGFTEHAMAPFGPHMSHIHEPPQPVDQVLEINSGAVSALGIKTGDKVELIK